jgi:hypothetical protein
MNKFLTCLFGLCLASFSPSQEPGQTYWSVLEGEFPVGEYAPNVSGDAISLTSWNGRKFYFRPSGETEFLPFANHEAQTIGFLGDLDGDGKPDQVKAGEQNYEAEFEDESYGVRIFYGACPDGKYLISQIPLALGLAPRVQCGNLLGSSLIDICIVEDRRLIVLENLGNRVFMPREFNFKFFTNRDPLLGVGLLQDSAEYPILLNQNGAISMAKLPKGKDHSPAGIEYKSLSVSGYLDILWEDLTDVLGQLTQPYMLWDWANWNDEGAAGVVWRSIEDRLSWVTDKPSGLMDDVFLWGGHNYDFLKSVPGNELVFVFASNEKSKRKASKQGCSIVIVTRDLRAAAIILEVSEFYLFSFLADFDGNGEKELTLFNLDDSGVHATKPLIIDVQGFAKAAFK